MIGLVTTYTYFIILTRNNNNNFHLYNLLVISHLESATYAKQPSSKQIQMADMKLAKGLRGLTCALTIPSIEERRLRNNSVLTHKTAGSNPESHAILHSFLF